MTEQAVWQRICAALDISKPAFETWIAPLAVVELGDEMLQLAAETQFNAEQAAKRYASHLATAASAVLGRRVRVQITAQGQALNNLNFKLARSTGVGSDPGNHAPDDPGFSQKGSNLNNLKASPEKKRGGVPRIQLFTDETLKKAIIWGVEEWLIQVCIRDYGEYTIKGQINRIHQIPDAYFKPQYGPIPQQRGRLFNKEMQKLKAKR